MRYVRRDLALARESSLLPNFHLSPPKLHSAFIHGQQSEHIFSREADISKCRVRGPVIRVSAM